MRSKKILSLPIVALVAVIGVSLLLAEPTFAQSTPAGVSNVNNFIKNIIMVFSGFAGLIATGFIVAGGFTYIMSSGNPDQLDKAKRTITWAAIGLAIVIAAFILANVVTDMATQAFGGQ